MEPQEPQRQTLPNCAQDCPLNDFLRLTEKAVPKNFEKECWLSPGNWNGAPFHYGTIPGNFETLKIQFPTSEGVSEVSKRAIEWAQRRARAKRAVWSKRTNKGTDEGVARYLRLYSCFFPDHSAFPEQLEAITDFLTLSLHHRCLDTSGATLPSSAKSRQFMNWTLVNPLHFRKNTYSTLNHFLIWLLTDLRSLFWPLWCLHGAF